MLKSKDKEKIEQYIDKIINEFYRNAKKNMQSGMPDKQVIAHIINVTVNKLTPESKMILSSTYNLLMEQTLSRTLYTDPRNKAAFYEMDIFKELNEKIKFDIPQKISYEESKMKINKWVKAGGVIVFGGIISISLGNCIFLSIAVIISGIMAYILKDDTGKRKQDVDSLIKEYLDNVKKSMSIWIDSVAEYYDERVSALDRKLVG